MSFEEELIDKVRDEVGEGELIEAMQYVIEMFHPEVYRDFAKEVADYFGISYDEEEYL